MVALVDLAHGAAVGDLPRDGFAHAAVRGADLGDEVHLEQKTPERGGGVVGRGDEVGHRQPGRVAEVGDRDGVEGETLGHAVSVIEAHRAQVFRAGARVTGVEAEPVGPDIGAAVDLAGGEQAGAFEELTAVDEQGFRADELHSAGRSGARPDGAGGVDQVICLVHGRAEAVAGVDRGLGDGEHRHREALPGGLAQFAAE